MANIKFKDILNEGPNFSLAHDKIEKWMPNDRQDQQEFYKLVDKKDVNGLADFIDMVADWEVLSGFSIKDKDTNGLAKYIVMNESTLTESREFVVIDPRGNARPVGSKSQGSQYTKKMGGPRKGYFIVLKKNALKARRAIEKAGGRFIDSKLQDTMFDLMYEGKINEEYIESMDDQAIDKHLSAIEMQWLDWKRGPMTDKEDVKPAAKELTHYILLWMRKTFK
jgi:hypothetical protein